MSVQEITTPDIDEPLRTELNALDSENFSLAKFCLEDRNDDDRAIITKGINCAEHKIQEYTYKQIKDHAKYVANIFLVNGIQKGDKILLLQNNSYDMAICYWATHYIGAVAICAIPKHAVRSYLLLYTNCKAVVAPESILDNLKTEISLKTNISLVLITDSNKTDQPYTVSKEGINNDDNLFDDVNSPVNEYSVMYFPRNFELDEKTNKKINGLTLTIKRLDECLWYFTSGTTGKPKGCVHNQIDLAFAGITYGKKVMMLDKNSVTATDTMMAGPYAMGSNLIFPFIAGSTVVLDHIVDPSIDKASKIFENFNDITTFISIPGSVVKIINLLQTDKKFIDSFSSVKVVTSAGAVLPASTFLNFNYVIENKKLSAILIDGIGTSELQHIFISNFITEQMSHKSSVGKLVPGYEAILLNEKQIGDGMVQGELAVRTISHDIMVKYSDERQPKGVNYKVKTNEVIHTYGNKKYYITGDIAAVRNNEPWFYLLGRTTELGSQLSGEDRSINDFSAVKIANDIMMKQGLIQNADQNNKKMYGNQTTIKQPLIHDVYVVKYKDKPVYIAAINESHWDDSDLQSLLKIWNGEINVDNGINIIFQNIKNIPRTPPPLLKPLKGKMTNHIKTFANNCGTDDIWLMSSVISMLETGYECPKKGTGGKRRNTRRRNRKSKKTRKSRKNRRKSNRRSRR
jgi:acyl-coenzyme A synthetase/AMP-(fatty) acid ligase